MPLRGAGEVESEYRRVGHLKLIGEGRCGGRIGPAQEGTQPPARFGCGSIAAIRIEPAKHIHSGGRGCIGAQAEGSTECGLLLVQSPAKARVLVTGSWHQEGHLRPAAAGSPP